MYKKLAILGSALGLAAAACAGTDTATTSAPPAPTSTVAATASPSSITVAVADSALGEILVDGAGNTLYLFTPDDSGPSVCNGDCAAAWPPVIGEATAGPGIDANLLGIAERDDGSSQATYNSWPLYYFARDAAPGDTNGQGFNDVWFVIAPTGTAIR